MALASFVIWRSRSKLPACASLANRPVAITQNNRGRVVRNYRLSRRAGNKLNRPGGLDASQILPSTRCQSLLRHCWRAHIAGIGVIDDPEAVLRDRQRPPVARAG